MGLQPDKAELANQLHQRRQNKEGYRVSTVINLINAWLADSSTKLWPQT
jgi:hypothetical protein